MEQLRGSHISRLNVRILDIVTSTYIAQWPYCLELNRMKENVCDVLFRDQ
jgi:hypothetical protein